jgi:NitT/TauT family transport system substrate-binding protein
MKGTKRAMKRVAFLAATGVAISVPHIALGKMTTVRIMSVPVESYALSYYALDQGFFARNGIDAHIQSTYSGAAISAAVIGRAVDIGCASIGPMSNAFLRGIPVRIIAGAGDCTSTSPTSAIAVSKSSSIMTARDLNDKTIGTSAFKDIQQVAVMKWMDLHGGDSRTTKTVELGLADAVAAILTRRIDAYPIVEPFYTEAGDTVRIIGYPYDSIGKRVPLGLHVAHNDWLQSNRATARRVVTALHEAAAWSNANRAAAGAILEKVSHVPATTIAKMHHVINAETFETAEIQREIDVLAEYRFIPRRYIADQIAWTPAVG